MEGEGMAKKLYALEKIGKLGRKTAAWKELHGKRNEADRLRAQLQLLEREVEGLKKEAGCMAYELWRGEIFCRDSLNQLFQQICDKGVEIRRLEEQIKELEQQAQALKQKIRGEKIQKEKPAGAADQVQAAEVLEGREDSGCPGKFTCPSCGQVYNNQANFCRKCGSPMGFSKSPVEPDCSNMSVPETGL